MAKQIYIDSNGNEVLVSGTITNDNNLPHFSGTPTAGTTAYEIASKQDILTTIYNSLTASANVTIVRSVCVKYGRVKQLSCVFRIDGTTSTIATIPNDYKPSFNIDFSAVGDNGTGARLRIQADSNTIEISNTLSSSSEYFAFTIAYI